MSERSLVIAHVTGESGFSGGEVQVFLLMEGLRARGHQSALVCPPQSRSAEEATRRGFAVYEVAMRNDLDPFAVRRIRAALRDCAPDLVHLHTGRANWLGGRAARREGIPAITTRRMDRAVKRGLRTRWLYGRAVRRAIAISPAVERCLHEGGVPASMTRVIWSAVDATLLAPGVPRERTRQGLGVEGDAFVVLCLASHDERKGLDVLLRALAILGPKAPTTWMAGDGPERKSLERLARELGITDRARFLGYREDKADLLAACDACVLPSRQEGLGIAALEAMASATPVIASRVGGLAEAVEDGESGILVPPDDPAALAEAIRRVGSDTALRARLAAGGPRRIAMGFRSDQMCDAYVAVYREILAEEPR